MSVVVKKQKAKQRYFRLVFPFLVMMILVACSAPASHTEYIGTCDQQTKQFMNNIHSFVVDELNPVIEAGFKSGPSADLTRRLEELDAKVSGLNTPECNTKAQAVKDALRQYMLETRNYFSTVAGRAIYGEGQVQGHLSKMYDAGWAFEVALEDLQK